MHCQIQPACRHQPNPLVDINPKSVGTLKDYSRRYTRTILERDSLQLHDVTLQARLGARLQAGGDCSQMAASLSAMHVPSTA